MNVAVLFGGKSTEYEISCRSAFNILENIKNHNVIKIGITRFGKWFYTDSENEDIRKCAWENDEKNVPVTFDFSEKKFIKNGKPLDIDVVFPILHGKNGEDGTIQGLFELLEIPYVGPGVLSSSLCMDKISANMVMNAAKIPHVSWDYTVKSEYESDRNAVISRFEKLGYPVFIKPSNAGSSVGITKCKEKSELENAIDTALKVDTRILAEHGLEDFLEIEVPMMGNENPVCGVVGRIASATVVYDYDSKYNNPTSEVILPADIEKDLEEKIKEIAKKAYRALSCKGLSRVDFLVTKNGEIFLNEINTIPGFTSISMFPMSFKKTGMTYFEIIEELINLAIKEHKNAR